MINNEETMDGSADLEHKNMFISLLYTIHYARYLSYNSNT